MTQTMGFDSESAYLIFRMPADAAMLAQESPEVALLMAMGVGPGDRLVCRPGNRLTVIKNLSLAAMPVISAASEHLEFLEAGPDLDPADVPQPLRRAAGLPDPPLYPPLQLVTP